MVAMMPAVPVPVMADAARAVVGQDDAAAAIRIIIVGRVIGPVVIGPVEVPMVVVREPVTAEVMSAVAIAATTNVVERGSGSEAAAAKMHTASTVTATAKMHAAAVATAATKMHAASTVATSAKMSAASTVTAAAATTTATTMAVHLRGQAFRDLLGHIHAARIDQ